MMPQQADTHAPKVSSKDDFLGEAVAFCKQCKRVHVLSEGCPPPPCDSNGKIFAPCTQCWAYWPTCMCHHCRAKRPFGETTGFCMKCCEVVDPTAEPLDALRAQTASEALANYLTLHAPSADDEAAEGEDDLGDEDEDSDDDEDEDEDADEDDNDTDDNNN